MVLIGSNTVQKWRQELDTGDAQKRHGGMALNSMWKVLVWRWCTGSVSHTHNCFTAIFPGLPRWAGARRNLLLDFYGAREDKRGRHTDNPAGRHSIQTNQQPTSIIPHFYAGCPSYRNPPTLFWLGTGTKYAPNMLAYPVALLGSESVEGLSERISVGNWLVWDHLDATATKTAHVAVSAEKFTTYWKLTLSTVNRVSKIPEVRTRQRSISYRTSRLFTHQLNYYPQTHAHSKATHLHVHSTTY